MKPKKILFILALLAATVGFFFFIYQNKIERINNDWNTKIEGKIDKDISSEIGPHGEHVQYFSIKNTNMNYIKNLITQNQIKSDTAIEQIKNIVITDLPKAHLILAKENHFGILTKDNCNLILWYSDDTNEVHLIENLS